MRQTASYAEEQDVWYTELKNLAEMWTTSETKLSTELEELEKRRIVDAMMLSDNNKSHAAKRLGIGRTLLIHKLKKYSIE